MRTFRPSLVFIGLLTVGALARCGPVVTSLQKGTPSLGSIGSNDPADGNSNTVSKAAVVADSTLVATSSTTDPANSSGGTPNPALLAAFKATGEIEVPITNPAPSIDAISVTLAVDLASERIAALNLNPISLTVAVKNDHLHLIAPPAWKDWFRVHTTAVTLVVNSQSINLKTDKVTTSKKK